MIRKPTGLAHLSWLCLWACCSASAGDFSWQEWQFEDSANPTSPTISSNCPTLGTVSITVGFLGSAWLQDLPGMGTRTGVWDLGFQDSENPEVDSRGRVDVSVPKPLPDSGAGYTDLGVKVVQFVDNFIYTGDLTFSLPGGTKTGRIVIEKLSGLGGNWVQDEFHWHLGSSPDQISLSITGSVNGTIIDLIRVDAVSVVPEIPGLLITSIEKSDQALAVSWTGGLPPYEVYVTSNLGESEEWKRLGEPVFGTNAEFAVAGSIGFLRVKGSN